MGERRLGWGWIMVGSNGSVMMVGRRWREGMTFDVQQFTCNTDGLVEARRRCTYCSSSAAQHPSSREKAPAKSLPRNATRDTPGPARGATHCIRLPLCDYFGLYLSFQILLRRKKSARAPYASMTCPASPDVQMRRKGQNGHGIPNSLPHICCRL